MNDLIYIADISVLHAIVHPCAHAFLLTDMRSVRSYHVRVCVFLWF